MKENLTSLRETEFMRAHKQNTISITADMIYDQDLNSELCTSNCYCFWFFLERSYFAVHCSKTSLRYTSRQHIRLPFKLTNIFN